MTSYTEMACMSGVATGRQGLPGICQVGEEMKLRACRCCEVDGVTGAWQPFIINESTFRFHGPGAAARS